MKIIALVENTTIDASLKQVHGLSLYIETPKHKVLFDLGPDDTYLHNAQKLGIDLRDVCTVVISHGHRDHGGALAGFLKVNDKDRIYLRQQAFEPHYTKKLSSEIFIGLNADLARSERLVFTGDTMQIDDELLLFSDVDGHFDTKSDRLLLKKISKEYVQDDFIHEQNLIIIAQDNALLFSSCSHRGITNILQAAHKHRPAIQAVFGGFHLYSPTTKAIEPSAVGQRLANELSAQESIFYTCHCTGEKAFESMRGIMGDKLQYLSTGSIIEFCKTD